MFFLPEPNSGRAGIGKVKNYEPNINAAFWKTIPGERFEKF